MEERAKFYLGSIGPWLPITFMIAGMLVSTMMKRGIFGMLIVAFASLVLAFLLVKDKKNYGKITITGLQNSILGTILVAYILAGVLAQLLRQSGLIDSLIWGITSIGLHAGLVPLIAFIVCMIISTACGTSTGSVAAVAPVLLPVADGLGINLGLMCGAIISGAIFGDNLAPISDTTISSSLTQEADIGKVVRTRFPYAMTSAIISMVLFVVVGLSTTSGAPADMASHKVVMQSFILLCLPLVMVFMMKKGWDLMSTLIVCDVTGIVLDLLLGCVDPVIMFSAKGPIVSGLTGMMVLVLYVILLFMLLQTMRCSGALEQMGRGLMKFCKSYRSGELVDFATASIGSIITGGSGIAIIFFGPFVRQITKTLGIDRCRGANILDGVACGVTGLMPHGNPTLISIGFVLAIPGVDPAFSFLDIIPYNFHCWGLILVFLISILTGIGRRYETPVPVEEQV